MYCHIRIDMEFVSTWFFLLPWSKPAGVCSISHANLFLLFDVRRVLEMIVLYMLCSAWAHY